MSILPSGTAVIGVETGSMKTGTGVVASCTDAVNSGAETGGTGKETAHSGSVFDSIWQSKK